MDTTVSVVIATHNRAAYLLKSIESIEIQKPVESSYELLVVDNASTDNTKDVVLLKAKTMANLRYIYEENLGLNHARNRGLKEAAFSYIAYLDDDAVAHPGWLNAIVRVITSVSPSPVVMGGKVLPIWESGKPEWLSEKMQKALSIVDYGENAHFLTGTEFLVGANMVFHGETLKIIGGFHSDLGRKGSRLTSNEEIMVVNQIKKSGHIPYYDPRIAVGHHIPAARLTKDWFRKRYFSQGYSDAIMWRIMENPSLSARMRRFFFFLYCFLRNPSYIFQLFRDPSSQIDFYKKLIAHSWRGYLKGILQK